QVHPGYRVALRAYERALRARNFLLKRDARPNWDQIDAYSQLLVEHGMVLTKVRRDLVESLSPWADEAQNRVSGRAEPLGLSYQAGGGDDLAASLEAAREEEARRRQTLVGPHRDDVLLTLHGMPAAQFASEGQQRTIALALKLAQAKLLSALRGQEPVMLLDDIFGELDPARRNSLLGYLPVGAQKWITTTHLDWARGTAFESAAVFNVEAGRVRAVG
ncbi:MAG: DNA replication/repair protein RecF, partial [Verrucomicrobiales bacterium]